MYRILEEDLKKVLRRVGLEAESVSWLNQLTKITQKNPRYFGWRAANSLTDNWWTIPINGFFILVTIYEREHLIIPIEIERKF
jgi:hypothetical protein